MKRFAAIALSSRQAKASVRLALYEVTPEGLNAVWADVDRPGGHKIALPHMIHSTAPNMPAFHFKVTPGPEHGGMTSSRAEAGCKALAEALARHYREEVSIQLLEGWPAVRPIIGRF